ncbi:uncharacterized protein CDAR_535591 [Caerostris darwini]|uniref:Uncharacterized protein n=1 Tax=Caerostris darwini TaxID=1538125 RepID=A0AAV4QPL6_9ARAC|nr:uncharacterized protein CDAR_535591 [Caerostris darwini]
MELHKICELKDTMRKKMSPDSLYKLCIQATSDYLQEKYWNRENTNPFSQVNCNVVNDVFRYLVIDLDIGKLNPLELLLKSGQLQNLDLDGCDFPKNQWKFLMTTLLDERDSCRIINCILLPESYHNDENSSLERLIEKCPLLETLDVSTFFNLSALKNCVRLKYVKNYYLGMGEYRYFWNEAADTLANLQNLERFDIFCCRNSSSYYRNIAIMLQNHPKLVSLGDTDSSWAAHHIHTTCRTDTVSRFVLKDCFWGYNRNVQRFDRNQIAYIQQFPEFVKSSVILFPLVEKLHIVVYNEDCMEHLKKLKHLRVLEIDFKLCGDSSAAFISLLSEIGHQLKCLSIVGGSAMPVDVVMKYCSNVVHLDLYCRAIVQGGIETDSKNFRQLKRLLVREAEEESLGYLLRNSLNLRELLLFDAVCLDDALLHEIFKFKNALSQVNTIAVYKCELSREGLKELVQKSVNLEKVAFQSLDADVTTVANELKRDIRATYSYTLACPACPQRFYPIPFTFSSVASQPPWPLARALPEEHHEEVGYSSSSPPIPPIEETCYCNANIFGDIVLRSVIRQRARCCGISADGSENSSDDGTRQRLDDRMAKRQR